MLEVETVADEMAFARLREPWNALLELGDGVFLRHEWFDAAWGWARESATLHVLCVRDSGRLIGIAPLCVRARMSAVPGIRVLEFLTIPDSPHCDFIARSNDRERVIECVLEHLRQQPPRCDAIEFARLLESATALKELQRTAARQGLRLYACGVDSELGVKLEGSWEQYYATRSRRLKKGNNLVANHLKRQYAAIEVERVDRSAGTEWTEQLIAEVTRISANSWKRGTGTTFECAGPGEFLRRWTYAALARGWLNIWLLRLDGMAVAAEFQVIDGDTVQALRADFDVAFDATSPGTYLNWQILQQLFDGRRRYYAMGTGHNTYKLRWSNATRELRGWRLYRCTPHGVLWKAWEEWLRPKLRWLRQLWQAHARPTAAVGSGDE